MTMKIEYKYVPVEPTQEMIVAGAEAARKYLLETGGNNPTVIYEAMFAAAPEQPSFTVDELSNEIRRVDGKHDMGAGLLAEKIFEFIAGKQPSLAEPLDSPDKDTREAIRNESPKVPGNICQLIEAYGNARADHDICSPALCELLTALREWGAALKSQPAQPSDTELSAMDKFSVIQSLIPALGAAGVTVTGSVKTGWNIDVSRGQTSDSQAEVSDAAVDAAIEKWFESSGSMFERMTAVIKAAMRAREGT